VVTPTYSRDNRNRQTSTKKENRSAKELSNFVINDMRTEIARLLNVSFRDILIVKKKIVTDEDRRVQKEQVIRSQISNLGRKEGM
jgi:antitoxin component YwqK of YwqJK toxin-antitoxin module